MLSLLGWHFSLLNCCLRRLSSSEIYIADVPFVVVDVETNGQSPRDGRVIEIACITVRDGSMIDEYTSLVNPRQHIPTSITRLTGISDAMVWNAPDAATVFRTVRKLFAQPYAVFVAHNVQFDWSFVQQSLVRENLPVLESQRLCTYKLSKRLFPKQKKLNLGALAAHLDINIKSRHRAFGDALATAQILIRLLETLQEDHAVNTLDELLHFQNKRLHTFKPMPRSIERLQETLKELPDEPGVYYFRSANDELLYIGKAKSLTARVHSYFQVSAQHSAKINELVRQVRDVQWTTTGTELSALLLESKEIKLHQPRYNTAIKRYRRYPFLRLGDDVAVTADAEGNPSSHMFPRVDVCFEISDDGAEYFGPFGSRGAAEAVVEMINRTFNLRKCSGTLHPDPAFTPCFYHQIKRCHAPCAVMQSAEEYAREVDAVRTFLSGEQEGILAVLRQAMIESSEQLAFEEAAVRRNQLKELERVFFRQKQISSSVNENNVILAVPTSQQDKKVEVFFIRHGRLRYQRLIGKKLPMKELAKYIHDVFFDGSTAPAHCRKEEIDEIRIIASWMYQHREAGVFLYTAGLGESDILDRLESMLYGILAGEHAITPQAMDDEASCELRDDSNNVLDDELCDEPCDELCDEPCGELHTAQRYEPIEEVP